MLGLGVVTLTIAVGVAQSIEPRPEVANRWCISGDCPKPIDGLGEIGKMHNLVMASSNISAHWQFGSGAPNVAPFLP